MIQEIISYAIVGGAFSIVAMRSARFIGITSKKTKKSKCNSCSAECVLKDMNLPDDKKCATPKVDFYL